MSIEAIILAIFVLISQNRTAKVDDLREETHLQINLITEKEITKLIKMLAILLEKQGVDLSQDPELKRMLNPISEEEIEKMMQKGCDGYILKPFDMATLSKKLDGVLKTREKV